MTLVKGFSLLTSIIILFSSLVTGLLLIATTAVSLFISGRSEAEFS